MKKIVLQCTGLLLAANLVLWWVRCYSPFDLPGEISVLGNAKLKVHGLILCIVTAAIIGFFLKRQYRRQPETTSGGLLSISILSMIFCEAIFQLIRQFTYQEYTPSERIQEYLLGVIAMSIWALIIGLIVAARLTGVRTTLAYTVAIALFFAFGAVYQHMHEAGYL